MTELLQNQIPLNKNSISRRAFLAGASAIVGAKLVDSSMPRSLRWVAENSGELLDTVVQPENIITDPIVALEPREDDTPLVAVETARPASKELETEFTSEDGASVMRFEFGTPLFSEHTHSPVKDDAFRSAGTAIITTAEGLVEGKQEYCRLFEGQDQVVAAGYEGGLYVYEPDLSKESKGEWVRVVTREEDQYVPTTTTSSWEEMTAQTSERMLIEDVVEGTDTLIELGYRPWAAILPSTKMPGMKNIELSPDTCASNPEEVANLMRSYFVTERGDIVDINHLQAKAGETLDLFVQLYQQHLTGEPHPAVSVKYAENSDARYVFSVQSESLQPDTIMDTTFSIMNSVTMLMEGVSQLYGLDKSPVMRNRLASYGGMNPEDLFANSLGVVKMINLIKERGLAKRIEDKVRAIHQNSPRADSEDVLKTLRTELQQVKSLLVKDVLVDAAQVYGVRPQNDTVYMDLPRGLYSLIPVKASEEDGTTPTNIDLQQAGLRADNPKTRYKAVDIPAVEITIGRILDKLGI